MKYQPSLDGLRALAVIAVLLAHCNAPFVGGGGRGVDVFFVLSGYLITSILMREPSLADFYMRRVRRLLPALFTFLAAYLLFGGLILPRDNRPRETLFALSYVQNWSMAFDYRQSGLGHTWSLAIEEQFYLAWPFVLRLLKRTTIPLYWLGASWMLLTALRIVSPHDLGYYATPLHATGLIAGAMVAFRHPSSRFGYPALALLAAVFAFGKGWHGIWAISAAEIGTALLIPALLHSSRLQSAFSSPAAVYVGLISYGVYLWHWPLALAFREHWPVVLVASLTLASLSYFFVEMPFRQSARRPSLLPEHLDRARHGAG